MVEIFYSLTSLYDTVGRGTEPPTLDSPKFNRQVAPHPSYPTRVGANARPVT